MGTDIVPSRSTAPALRLPTRLNRDLGEVEHRALVYAARVQAAVYVGNAALIGAAQLSATQAELEKLNPGAALRLAAITDAGVAAIQAELLSMGVRL